MQPCETEKQPVDDPEEREHHQQPPDHNDSDCLGKASVTRCHPEQQLQAALVLASAMPPSRLKKNVIGLALLARDIEDVLFQKIELPLEISETTPGFLQTEFSRSGDSYRSPHTNTYFPGTEGYQTSGMYRQLEQVGNTLFAEYTKLYYGNSALCSFYVCEGTTQDSFSCGYFAKKQCDADSSDRFTGTWDSFNIVDIVRRNEEFVYSLTTTVLIQMAITQERCGSINLTGYFKQSKNIVKKLGNVPQKQLFDEHLTTVGQLVEDMETKMRQNLEGLYISKTKAIIFTTRYERSINENKLKQELAHGLRDVCFGDGQ